MKSEHLERIEPRTLRENVTEILRQSIINGSLPPGSELNQVQIAEQLGTSRGPVREALGQLEQEGLIENIPYKGVLVTQLSRRYVEEIYSVRAALEKLALDRAIDQMNDDEIAELDNIVDQMRAAAKRESLDDLVALDLAFHEYIMRQADHHLAWKLWKQLEIGVQRCLHVRHEIYTFLDEVVGSHPTLVTAIQQRNKAWAFQILDEHIGESASHIFASLPEEEDEDAVAADAAEV
jgi:DNA-binding GntR family transcriptional regulator